MAERLDVREVAIDRWNSTAVITALQRENIPVATFGQGFASMAAPVRELKRAILGGDFRHGGNPLLRLCFANVVAEKDEAENEKFTEERRAAGSTGRWRRPWPWAAPWPATRGRASTRRPGPRGSCSSEDSHENCP